MTSKVVVKTVADVPTLQAAAPTLGVTTPVIVAGHPNEASMAAQYNLAQSVVTVSMISEAVSQGNLLGATKNWRP